MNTRSLDALALNSNGGAIAGLTNALTRVGDSYVNMRDKQDERSLRRDLLLYEERKRQEAMDHEIKKAGFNNIDEMAQALGMKRKTDEERAKVKFEQDKTKFAQDSALHTQQSDLVREQLKQAQTNRENAASDREVKNALSTGVVPGSLDRMSPVAPTDQERRVWSAAELFQDEKTQKQESVDALNDQRRRLADRLTGGQGRDPQEIALIHHYSSVLTNKFANPDSKEYQEAEQFFDNLRSRRGGSPVATPRTTAPAPVTTAPAVPTAAAPADRSWLGSILEAGGAQMRGDSLVGKIRPNKGSRSLRAAMNATGKDETTVRAELTALGYNVTP
jgi:hypothetical protein